MNKVSLQFKILNKDKKSHARLTQYKTFHGQVDCPTFMPVGTQATVKTVTPAQVEETGAQVVLANTYHMSLSNREKLVKRIGGLHKFMGWNKTILTDSGGFQVFSLPDRIIQEDGVRFSYSDDGNQVFLSPEISMQLQKDLGADIVMAFDECAPYPAEKKYIKNSVERTSRWAQRCLDVSLDEHQYLFGIVQGGVYEDMRTKSAESICSMDFDGFAIGGVSVGEGYDLLKKIVNHTGHILPDNKPRYLMGVGLPEDIFESVASGIDMFDCVIPTRYARNGTLFTSMGKMRIMNKKYRKDKYPIDSSCSCYTCRNFSRMYLRHLFFSKEPLAETLCTIHNIHFYETMMKQIRESIEKGNFLQFREEWLNNYTKNILE